MEKQKLDNITEHAALIQKLAGLLPNINPISKMRVKTIIDEAQMIKELIASLKDGDE